MGWTVYNSDGKILQSAELGDNAVTSAKIADGAIVNADINASAVIAYSKLAALADGNILVGNGSNVAVSVNPSGDVDIANDGTFSIATGAVVNADVNSSAAIAYTKLAALTDGNILVGNGSNVAVSVSPSGDVDISNTGAFSIASGVVVNADVNASAAIAFSKMENLTNSRLLVSDGSGDVSVSAVTAAEMLQLSGISANVTDTNLNALTGSGATALHSHSGGGVLEFIGTNEATDGTDTTLVVTGLDTSVYDYFEIQLAGITPVNDNVALQVRFGDSGGIDSGASDYAWAKTRFDENATASATSDTSDSLISIAHALGNQTTEGYSGTVYINTGDLTCHTTLYGLGAVKIFTGTISLFTSSGQRFSNLTLTQVQIFMNGGNISTGRMTVWGRKHA